MTRQTEIITITCSDSGVCAQTILEKLEASLGLKLHADLETDIVNGSLSISHDRDGTHTVSMEIYDSNEAPTGEHKTTLERPSVFPDEATRKMAIQDTVK